MNEQMDDFDLEVSSLDPAPDTAGGQDADSVSFSRELTHAQAVPSSTRHVNFAPHLTRSKRLQRAGSLIAIVAVLVTALLLVPAGTRASILKALIPPSPAPTATPQAGDDTFLWEHSVPWGRLLIDGQPGPDVRGSAMYKNTQGFPLGAAFHLSRGHHTLEYRAAPFPTLRCVISVPPARADTCPLDLKSDITYFLLSAPQTRVLDLQATVDRLPAAHAQALIAATQAALTALASARPQGTIALGDHYLDGAGHLNQAITPLSLQPTFQVASSLEEYEGVACVTLCTRTGIFEVYTSAGWALLAPVYLTWRYTTPAGELALADGPAGALEARRSIAISLLARWSGASWQTPTPVYAAPQADPVICPTGEHYREVVQLTPSLSMVNQDFVWPYAASTAELGCLYAGGAMDPTTGTVSGPMALVLYRAGALTAVNERAHQVFPSLPLASAHERALAQAVTPTHIG